MHISPSRLREGREERAGRAALIDRRTLWIVRLLTLAALSVATYLAITSLMNQSPAGCGEDGGCGRVLASRFSRWFGLPVAIPAVSTLASQLVLLGFIGTSLPERVRNIAGRLLAVTVITHALAAVWFIALQILMQHLCGYCMAVHVCNLLIAGICLLGRKAGMIASVMSGVVAAISIGILAVGGLLSDDADRFEIRELAANEGEPIVLDGLPSLNASMQQEVSDRTLASGYVVVRVGEVPLRGKPSADRIVAKFYDYTCPHCRTMHRWLVDSIDASDGQFAVSLHPVPLNSSCNRHVSHNTDSHRDACELARLALAVWRVDALRFAEMHDWLFTGDDAPTAEAARKYAEQLVDATAIDAVLAEESIDRVLQTNVRVYDKLGRGVIPKILFSDRVLTGHVDRSKKWQKILADARYD